MSAYWVAKKSVLVCSLLTALIPASVMAASSAEDEVLLRDGVLIITREDMIRYIDSAVPESERQGILSSQDRMVTLLQNIYMTRSLAARADEFDVSLDPRQLAWEQDFNRDTKLVIAVQEAAIAKAQAGVNWDALAREKYIAEGESHMTDEQVDAAHILIKLEGRDKNEALALAKKVRQEALDGADFNALAKQYSEDQSAQKNGGELGAFKHAAMVKPFSDAAFAMKEPGSISEPVESRFGYHIIKLNERIPAKKKGFEEVKPRLVRSLKGQMAAQVRDAILTDTRSKPGVDVNRDLLDDIRNSYIVKIEK